MSSLKRLAELVEKVGGIVTPEREVERLKKVANVRMAATGAADLESYARMLEERPDGEEWRKLLRSYTVKESYLFRAHQQFDVLSRHVLPNLVTRTGQNLRLWSAGCAHGEEPASLAVVLASRQNLVGDDWSILGTDIDEEALNLARMGVFSSHSMRRVPQRMSRQFFAAGPGCFRLRAHLRSKISYRYLNLVQGPMTSEGGPFHVIFLRNVLIYFNRENQQKVVDNVAAHLAPEGYLFVGPSESLWQMSQKLDVQELDGCFVYRHRNRQRPTARATPSPAPQPRSAAEPPGRAERRHSLEVGGGRPSGDPSVHLQAGLAAEWGGRLADAVRHYRAARYLDENLVDVRFLLARCLAACDWLDRARAEYRAILDLIESGRGRCIPGASDLGLPGLREIERVSRRELEG